MSGVLVTLCLCSMVLLTVASTSTSPRRYFPLIPPPVQPHSGCQCLLVWEQQGEFCLSVPKCTQSSFPLSRMPWEHSLYFPARQLQSAICPAFFHSQELLLIIPASKGPFPSEPAVGSLNISLSAAELSAPFGLFLFISQLCAPRHGC